MKVLDKIVLQKRNQFQPSFNSLATTDDEASELVSLDTIDFASRARGSTGRIERASHPTTTGSAFHAALNAADIAIIGEIKPRSPSAGRLLDVDRLGSTLELYKKHCVAISVLTDSEFFGGSFDLLARVKRETNLPVLCKDFIVSTEQILLAKKAGADAILLIVKILSQNELIHLFKETNRQGLDAVVEVNDENDLEKLKVIEPQIVLINNRNLETMAIDLQTTARLANRLSPQVTVISASGIKTEADVRLLQSSAKNFLIGTSLLQSNDLDVKLNSLKSIGRGARGLRSNDFRSSGSSSSGSSSSGSQSSELRSDELRSTELRSSEPNCTEPKSSGNQNAPHIKVCGITSASDALLAVDNGATFIGLIFAPNSPRYIDVETAHSICAAVRNKTKLVGVFQNQSLELVNKIAEELDLDFVQLHGSEDADYITDCNRPVIKAIEYRVRKVHAGKRNGQSFESADVVLSTGGKPITSLENFNRAKYILFDLPKVNMAAVDVSASRIALAAFLSQQKMQPFFIAGKLSKDTICDAITLIEPFGIDVASAVEVSPGIKSPQLLSQFCDSVKFQRTQSTHSTKGSDMKLATKFGNYGGTFVPETLMPALEQLEDSFLKYSSDITCMEELSNYLKHYAGRPTPLYYARNLSEKWGAQIYLKREDLLHGGAHKTNNAIGQALLAKFMGKQRLIAETGAGQHGVACAMAGAMLGLPVEVYMGSTDVERQHQNVQRMELLGARVHRVDIGGRTLKDAINAALRDWVSNLDSTHYVLGTAAGPHPFPTLVKFFQSIIGKEAKEQFSQMTGTKPDAVIACVGGGSNAIGIFSAFIDTIDVKLIGVEPGGRGVDTAEHGAVLQVGEDGCLHGMISKVLQDQFGQIKDTHSIAAGLDYPSVGPEHAHLNASGRAVYGIATDDEAVAAFQEVSRLEGIIPALESSHALAYVRKHAMSDLQGKRVLINVSGRGDKDLARILEYVEQNKRDFQ